MSNPYDEPNPFDDPRAKGGGRTHTKAATQRANDPQENPFAEQHQTASAPSAEPPRLIDLTAASNGGTPTTQNPPPSANPQFYNPPPGQHPSPAYHPPDGGNTDSSHQQHFQHQQQSPQQQRQMPPPPPPAGQQPPPQQGQQQEQLPQARDLKTSKCWTVEFYQQFFDVNAKDVLTRMGNTLVPFYPPDFLRDRKWHAQMPATLENVAAQIGTTGDGVERTPDAYGPFWLCTTLWVVIAVVGNLLSKLEHMRSDKHDKWTYDFKIGTIAMAVVYAYWALMSLLVWALMKWKEVPASCLDVLCLYGYAMFPFLCAALFCAVPSMWFQWIIVLFLGFWSGLYLLLNFWQLWKQTLDGCWFIGIVLLVSIFHIGFTIAMKLVFFNYKM